MTGDLGSDAGGARSRPQFLPPDDGPPPPAPGDAAPPPSVPEPPAPPRGGVGWSLSLIASAAALLVSAFLPWARASVVVDLFGSAITREVATAAGIDADDVILSVPVFAVVAIVMASWDLLARDSRITALAAVPGVLSLLACLLFLLRLGDARDDLPTGGLDVGYEISVQYGWYVAVAASLLVTGFSLARPISARLGGAGRRGRPHSPEHYAQDPYFAQGGYQEPQYQDAQYQDGRYANDPNAVWPQNGWGADEPARPDEPAPPGAAAPRDDRRDDQS
ncbi:hypothetical protein [Actinomadura algeriensis]|uniref:Integral membrane protein n=1 Tax=Actinomadura algeriensis TaxID=1679523 RepID=A0ABR9JXC2_9ACTN|nr:hypothetical protein [Actinomadura algeriensis]MBE1534991.1 hypothetical protein [Actinomadura algeriensis]